MSKVRTLVSVILIIVAALLTIPANVAAWQEREVENEDQFVSTITEAFEQPEVQETIANRMADAIMARAEIPNRIDNLLETLNDDTGITLPDGIFLLQDPLTNVAREAIYRASLRVLQSDRLEQILETSLRATHRLVMAVIDEDFELIEQTDDKVVLNLQVLLEAIVLELAPNRGDALLDRLDLPEEAGQIVLFERDEPPLLWLLMRYLQFSFPWVIFITLVVMALAVAIAPNRRRALILAGSLTAGVTFLTLWLVSEPARTIAADSIAMRPDGEAAVKAIYDVMLNTFKAQQVIVIIVSMTVVVASVIAGDKDLVAAVRGAPESQGLGHWVRKRATTLRIFGLAVGAFFLLAWPDASDRMLFTVLGLLGLYLGALWMATSNANWAVRSRERLRDFRSKLTTPDIEDGQDRSFASWVGRHAMLLRITGIVVGLAAFLVWPTPGVGVILAIIGIELLYMAAIDAFASRREVE